VNASLVPEAGGLAPGGHAAADFAIAFVIPAFNEERLLPETLESIDKLLRDRLSYEIVVVDNGSTDGTLDVARRHHATTDVLRGVTVGALRNHGARLSSARVLVFLDADVVITCDWASHIEEALHQLADDPSIITGSACGVPYDASWLERNWFGPWQTGRTSHMNSGHMIIARTLFETLGGFAEQMQTGEDYEFSLRAQKTGARLLSNPLLSVIHNGYPKSLGAFMKREIWHGRSDFESMQTIVRSPIAMAAFAFVFLHVMLVTGLMTGSPPVTLFGVCAIALICLAAAIRQYRHQKVPVILSNAVIYYFYFAARFFAFVKERGAGGSFVHRESR
jgi:GT2 family glycosyltransferase